MGFAADSFIIATRPDPLQVLTQAVGVLRPPLVTSDFILNTCKHSALDMAPIRISSIVRATVAQNGRDTSLSYAATITTASSRALRTTIIDKDQLRLTLVQ